MYKGQESTREFFIASGDSSKLFNFIEKPLYLVAQFVCFLVAACLFLSIAPRRYHGNNPLLLELVSYGSRVIALVQCCFFEIMLFGYFLNDFIKYRRIMALTASKNDNYSSTFIYTGYVDFGGESTPRTSKSLSLLSAVFF